MAVPSNARQGGQAPSKLTAQAVIEMFAEYGLPVCDDADQIKQRVDAKRPSLMKQLSSPQPMVHQKAEIMIQNADAMLNRRADLLEEVYSHFAALSDTALAGFLASGVTKFTPQLKEGLSQKQAVEACHVTPDLAERFLTRYMQDHGFHDGEIFVTPGAITKFQATSLIGEIRLTWILPVEKCDEVEIFRQAESGGKKNTQEKLVYHGTDTEYVDGGVNPGTWASYRAHSVYQKVAGNDTSDRAVCMAEVNSANAEFIDGRICLSWEKPGGGARVRIYRCSGQEPALQSGAKGIESKDKTTREVYNGAGSSWDDTNIAEGEKYYYTLLVDYGELLQTQGICVNAWVPQPPPDVPLLKAQYTRTGKEDGVVVDTVFLKWEPIPGDMPVEYVLVRREGSAPPSKIDEGILVTRTSQLNHLDDQIEPGHRYTYAVFAQAGDLYSRKCAAAQLVDILSDVSNLDAQIGDRTVELSWQTPANTEEVIVRRGLHPPVDHNDGIPVKLTGAGNAKDENLDNGQCYHYLVCCLYKPDGINQVVSTGSRKSAVPERLPDPVTDFKTGARGREIFSAWSPPATGQAVVIRSAAPHPYIFGQRLSADAIDSLGERIVANNDGSAIDPQPDINRPYYSIFTVAGPHAVTGGVSASAVCSDISNLRLAASHDGITLRWSWPQGCRSVRILRKEGDWPKDPTDPQAVSVPFTQVEYRDAGDKYIDLITTGHGKYFYIVYAQVATSAGNFCSLGNTLDCRAEVQWEEWTTLRYRLEFVTKGPHKEKDIHLTWAIEKPFKDFSGFILVASQNGIPTAPGDGFEIFRCSPGPELQEGSHEAWIGLNPIQQKRWARFFCKAFVIEPSQRLITLIVHPNTTIPYSASGRPDTGMDAASVKGYQPGVPKTVICPFDFEVFPVERMLFDSYTGGEAKEGIYSTIDRIRGNPVKPPVGKDGQLLTRKLCPAHQHVLPFTAGLQSSLIIGLIGAVHSGKSHFIASLIQRLENQVGSDMQAALLPVTDETQDRYLRDFYNPLFKNSLELAKTAGVPAPLIYDLTLDGRLWEEKRNRAVTLSFYDTAGENLQDPAIARQMMHYLREASGVIFLVDPLQVPAVRESLPTNVQPPSLDNEAAPKQIISNVLQLLEQGKVLEANAPISIPVAIVLTKFDVLVNAGLVETNRLWSTEMRHTGFFDTEAQEDMSGMIGEYFQRWNPEAYNNIRLRFSHHAFFGASATGCASDPQTHRYKYISPWRVEDPLLWLLAQLNVIPKR